MDFPFVRTFRLCLLCSFVGLLRWNFCTYVAVISVSLIFEEFGVAFGILRIGYLKYVDVKLIRNW